MLGRGAVVSHLLLHRSPKYILRQIGSIVVEEIKIEDRLCEFLRNFTDDLNGLELVLFFGRHPNAKFNRTAVLHALNTRQFDAGLALKKLINRKIVVTCSDNGITLYSLTGDESIRSLIISLVNLGQRQWQLVLEQILKDQGYQDIQ